MAEVIILGSASAVPGMAQENTHLFVQAGRRAVLIDCPGSPLVRLAQAGLDTQTLTDVILTHFHPDHVSGFAPLLMGLWLQGRKQPLNVHGLQFTIERAQQMLELYGWTSWPGFYAVNFHVVDETERAVVLQDQALAIYASPAQHLIPTLGLRVEFLQEHKVLAYSCDTEPSAVIERLAAKADLLIHEATGEGTGHTSAEQAGEVARRADAGALTLIHYPPEMPDLAAFEAQAAQTYGKPVHAARDLETLSF